MKSDIDEIIENSATESISVYHEIG